jgi:hypothetical protein
MNPHQKIMGMINWLQYWLCKPCRSPGKYIYTYNIYVCKCIYVCNYRYYMVLYGIIYVGICTSTSFFLSMLGRIDSFAAERHQPWIIWSPNWKDCFFLNQSFHIIGTIFVRYIFPLFSVYSPIRNAKKIGFGPNDLETLHCPGAGLRPNQGAVMKITSVLM